MQIHYSGIALVVTDGPAVNIPPLALTKQDD